MAPFLAMIGDPDVSDLSAEQAHKLREMCLIDYKQQLLQTAELIHARFEKVNFTFLTRRSPAASVCHKYSGRGTGADPGFAKGGGGGPWRARSSSL